MNATLEARLSRLERTNRCLLVIVLLLVTVALLGFARAPSIVSAQGFQLVDNGGAVRAQWLLEDGNPRLQLNDASGNGRLVLFHDEAGSGLHVNDADAVTRIGIVQFAHGGGGVALHGPASRGAAVLYFKDSGSLRLFDADGNLTNALLAEPRQHE